MYETKPEIIGIYSIGIKSTGGGGGGTGGTVSITIPPANTTDPGVVITGNTSNAQLTSASTNVVPTLWWMQQEVGRLETAISSAGVIQYTPISSYPPPED